MNYKGIILVFLIALLLVGCSSGGPSNAEAKEVIYGVYLSDAKVVKKQQCKLTDAMKSEGHTNVWLVIYKLEGSDRENGMLLSESDSDQYPWEIYRNMVTSCP